MIQTFQKILFLLVSLYFLTGCVTEQVTSQNKNNANTPDKLSELTANRALSYMRIEQYKTAEDLLSKELKKNPSHSNLNYTYALLKLRLKEMIAAGQYFEKAVKNDPKNSIAAHDYGYYLCSQGQKEKGVTMFDLALSNPLFKQKSKSSLRAGECVFNIDPSKSEKYFLNSLEENKQTYSALYRLAELYFSQGKAFKARAYYQRYISATGDSPAALLLGYKIEKLSKADKEADKLRSRLLNNFPGSAQASQLRTKRK